MKAAVEGLLARARSEGRRLLGVGVHSAFTAAVAERSGFDVVWVSSLELSAHKMLPDANLITLSEVTAAVRDICRSCRLPVVVDADNGYGSDETSLRAAIELSAAGATAMSIEDNEFPKRCSFYEDVDRGLMEPDALARRIERIVSGGTGIEVIARTEALVAGMSPAEAIRRVRTYVDAGAHAVFVQTTKHTLDAFYEVLREVRPFTPIMVTPTALAATPARDLHDAGADLIVYSNVVIRTVLRALTDALTTIRLEERLTLGDEKIATLDELFDVTRVDDWVVGPAETGRPPAAAPAPRLAPPVAETAPAPAEPAPIASLDQLADLARTRLDPRVYAYCAAGAGDEAVLRANVAAFDRYKLRPCILGDVSSVSTSTAVLGEEVSVPILVAPMALQRMLHPDGEAATAWAASRAGAGLCLSTFSSVAPEDVAALKKTAPQWFQLYPLRWEIVESLLDRAAAARFSAVVVTVDAAVRPPRKRDVATGFDPFAHTPPALFEDAGFRACLEEQGLASDPAAMVRALFPNPALTWDDLRRICAMTELPVVVKGVIRSDDALRARDAGAAGVVVSNHGGRQCDDLRPSIDCLEEVARAAGNDVEVFFDSGIRRGAHVLKALALGARAVLLGRPVLWGLAAGGEEGVARVLDLVAGELTTAIRLAGVTSVGEIDRDVVT